MQAKPELGPGWFMQRYYVCDKHWRPPTRRHHANHAHNTAHDDDAEGDAAPDGDGDGAAKGPIFFYVGNEADVQL